MFFENVKNAERFLGLVGLGLVLNLEDICIKSIQNILSMECLGKI